MNSPIVLGLAHEYTYFSTLALELPVKHVYVEFEVEPGNYPLQSLDNVEGAEHD